MSPWKFVCSRVMCWHECSGRDNRAAAVQATANNGASEADSSISLRFSRDNIFLR